MEWIYGFSRSSVWLSKMWNFPFSMFSEIVLPMTVLPPAIFATSICPAAFRYTMKPSPSGSTLSTVPSISP